MKIRWDLLKKFKINENSKRKILKGLTNENILFQDENIVYKNLNMDFGIFIDREKEKKIVKNLKTFPKIYFFNNEICIRDYKNSLDKFQLENLNENKIKSFLEKLEEINSLTNLFQNEKKSKLERILENENFLNKIEEFLTKNEKRIKKEDFKLFKNILKKFYSARKNLHNFIKRENPKNNLLCHNDLTLDNIFIKQNEVFLLDYEYSDINPIYYEFANFFVECKLTFTNTPPFFVFNQNRNFDFLKDNIFKYFLEKNNFEKKEFFDKVEDFEIFSHFFWLNVTIMSSLMDIELDLNAYGNKRLELFENIYNQKFI